jgi:phytoene synthase
VTADRLVTPARSLRETIPQPGGMRKRSALVAHARKAIRKGSKSFAAASLLFDRATREKVLLLYAWCRRCDDLADAQDHGGELGDQADAANRINGIRALTQRAFEGLPTADPAFDALGLLARESAIVPEMAEDVIAGFALDAEDWRPRNEQDLMRYCYHVGGAVGVMMAVVMGIAPQDEQTLDRACDLGLAFQLANIARDLREDDAVGRCYLPLEWLAEADIPPGQHMKPVYRRELVELVSRLVALAEEYEASGRSGAAQLRFRQRWAVLSAANIYGAIGRKARSKGAHAWDHPLRIGGLAKLGFMLEALWQTLTPSPRVQQAPKWRRLKLADPASRP